MVQIYKSDLVDLLRGNYEPYKSLYIGQNLNGEFAVINATTFECPNFQLPDEASRLIRVFN